MIKCRITRIESNHREMRTDSMDGVCETLPQVGSCVHVLGKGLVSGIRSLITTPVEHVVKEDGYMLFRTRNSLYKFEIL